MMILFVSQKWLIISQSNRFAFASALADNIIDKHMGIDERGKKAAQSLSIDTFW